MRPVFSTCPYALSVRGKTERLDAGFALHDQAFPYGYVRYRVGVGSSNADGLYIRFKGRGGHGAVPQATIDPVMMASRFVVDVQSVISREKDPTEFGVVSIGSLHAGTAGNIIPDEAVLLGTIRTFKPDVRAKMHDGIERTAKAVAAMAGMSGRKTWFTLRWRALITRAVGPPHGRMFITPPAMMTMQASMRTSIFMCR